MRKNWRSIGISCLRFVTVFCIDFVIRRCNIFSGLENERSTKMRYVGSGTISEYGFDMRSGRRRNVIFGGKGAHRDLFRVCKFSFC